MKISLIVFVLIFSISAQAQVIPVGIKRYLDLNYSGWKAAPTAKTCGQGLRSIVSGDFDGDRKTDYTVKIIKGHQGFILAFLAKEHSFKPFVLHEMSAKEITETVLGIFKKGQKYYPEPGNEDLWILLKTDAPYDATCESDAGDIHLYKNGKFENR